VDGAHDSRSLGPVSSTGLDDWILLPDVAHADNEGRHDSEEFALLAFAQALLIAGRLEVRDMRSNLQEILGALGA
jgi:hypothetical protein